MERERYFEATEFENIKEIDIIAMNGNRIVFVEVKTRRDYDEDPFAAITPAKISRLVRAANAYVIAYDIPHDVQYDFIAVMGNPHEYKIVHLPDVWVPLSCTRRR